ncbi:MAG: Diaminopropionate ammonia-lyase [Gammaproteobacteria bacterium]|nr:Diaminopropionate ammonia-lyase [Gammaproteobacteria bacterium]
MEAIYRNADVRHIKNPCFNPAVDYPADLNGILGSALIMEAQDEISRWDGYSPTPLYPLCEIAGAIDVKAIYYKDESRRFAPGSFKALGGAYAVEQLLKREVSRRLGREISLGEIRNGRYAKLTSGVTVATATDGNHGRSVAWGAARFGCSCVIYIHRHVSEGRCAAMESFGARVIRVEGNYDDSVRQARLDAAKNGWYIVSDTSYPGYMTLPRYVMAGYTVMIKEALEQIPDRTAPTCVFLQGGCGGLAAAIAGYLWQALGEHRPRLIVVEPVQADCLYQSVSACRRVDVNITEESSMAGLSCGEVSILAWGMVQAAVNDFLSMNDDLIGPTMRLLARRQNGTTPIVAGESAVPGLAALLAASWQTGLRDALDLGVDSQVLIFGTEGATDPQIYKNLVGAYPGEICAE